MSKYHRRRKYYRRNTIGRYHVKPNSKQTPPPPMTEEEKEAFWKLYHLHNDPRPRRAWEPYLDGPYLPGFAPRRRFIPRGTW